MERIVINSTVGIAGLIDVAAKIGIPYHATTSASPWARLASRKALIGAAAARSTAASRSGRFGVDGFFDPLSWARFHGKDTWMFARGGLRVIDTVDQTRDQFESIERSSLDFYASTRNLYRQSRELRIQGGAIAGAELPDL